MRGPHVCHKRQLSIAPVHTYNEQTSIAYSIHTSKNFLWTKNEKLSRLEKTMKKNSIATQPSSATQHNTTPQQNETVIHIFLFNFQLI